MIWLLLACGGGADEVTELRIYCEVVDAHPKVEGQDEQVRLMAIVEDIQKRYAEAGVDRDDNLMTRMSTTDPAARKKQLSELAAKGKLETVCQTALSEL